MKRSLRRLALASLVALPALLCLSWAWMIFWGAAPPAWSVRTWAVIASAEVGGAAWLLLWPMRRAEPPAVEIPVGFTSADIRVLAERAAKADARADRYFQSVETIGIERNQWYEAYMTAVAGHGRAQEMMMGEIRRLSRRLVIAARALEGDAPDVETAKRYLEAAQKPELDAIQREYAQTHDPESGIGSKIDRPALPLTDPERESLSPGA